MTKLLKILFVSMIALGLASTVANANTKKGQKLFIKKLKTSCGLTGASMAQKHSQDEWEAINTKKELAKEIKIICPKAKDSAMKAKYLPHYYDFFFEYANDSGNVPSC